MKLQNFPLPKKNLIVKLIFWSIFILFFTLSYFSEGSAGGADTYVHYFFSKESWNAHYLWLYHWSKPVFTLLSSPFSQFGYNGIKLFNILIGLLSAYAAYRIASYYGFKFKIPLIFLILFAPIYMLILFSGLTEILFGTFLIVSVWLIIEKKYTFSAILISFIMFARTEGIVFILLWAFLFIINKKYKAIPFLLTGFIFYGIVGSFFHYHDFFWFFTKNPYLIIDVDYGKGELLFYVKAFKETFGYLLCILIILGLITYIIFLFKSYRAKNFLPAFNETAMIAGIPVIYFVMHSIFWWKGMMHVLGDIRFMASIIPFCGLIAVKGIHFIFQKTEKKIILFAVSFLIITIAIISPFKIYQFPIPLKDENLVIKKAVDWLKTTPYISKRILFYNPIIPELMDRDPFHDTTMLTGMMLGANPKMLNPGDIFIWDTHFAGIEGKIKQDSFTNDVNYELLMVFNPDISFSVLGGENYSVKIFQKTSSGKTGTKSYSNDTLKIFSFENDTQTEGLIEFPENSGNKVCPLNGNRVYSPTLDTSLARFDGDNLLILNAKTDIFFPKKTKSEVFLVVSIENETGSKYYDSKTVTDQVIDGKTTLELNEQYFLPEVRNYRLKVYVYIKDNKEVYIDNLLIIKKKTIINY
jgi:hypothetical protein